MKAKVKDNNDRFYCVPIDQNYSKSSEKIRKEKASLQIIEEIQLLNGRTSNNDDITPKRYSLSPFSPTDSNISTNGQSLDTSFNSICNVFYNNVKKKIKMKDVMEENIFEKITTLKNRRLLSMLNRLADKDRNKIIYVSSFKDSK